MYTSLYYVLSATEGGVVEKQVFFVLDDRGDLAVCGAVPDGYGEESDRMT